MLYYSDENKVEEKLENKVYETEEERSHKHYVYVAVKKYNTNED